MIYYRDHYRIFSAHPSGSYRLLKDNSDGSVRMIHSRSHKICTAYWLSDGRLSRVKPNEYEPLDHFVRRVQETSRKAVRAAQVRSRSTEVPEWAFEAVRRSRKREIVLSGEMFYITLDGLEFVYGKGDRLVADACLSSYLDGKHVSGVRCFPGFMKFKDRWIRDDE